MQTIRKLTGRVRFLVVSIALVNTETCGTASHACGREPVGKRSTTEAESSHTHQDSSRKSGMPTPVQVSTFANAAGLAFDKSYNLWAVIDPNRW